jgi:CheY-like chemotaxis protein/DNA-directed RNA polymerase subunit RPC12/RpoP
MTGLEVRSVALAGNDLLIVDDNSVLVSILKEIFVDRGHAVRSASDGFSALTLIRDKVPDVLVSDLNMPRMSGYELLSIVRRRFPSIAVIAMSGAYSSATIPDGVAADAFYAKGQSSVACLLQILRAVEVDAGWRDSRTQTPIWIPDVLVDREKTASASVACPECLRTFLHPIPAVSSVKMEERCPYCDYRVQIALVGRPLEMDRTVFALPRHSANDFAS